MIQIVYIIGIVSFLGVAATASHQDSPMAILLQAIKTRDVCSVETLIKDHSYTDQEQRIILAYAASMAQTHEQGALLSAHTKKSIMSIACLSLATLSLPLIAAMECWFSGRDSFEELRHCAPEIYRFFCPSSTVTMVRNIALHGLAIIGCVDGAWTAGFDCQTGYYTHPHIYIDQLLRDTFPQSHTSIWMSLNIALPSCQVPCSVN